MYFDIFSNIDKQVKKVDRSSLKYKGCIYKGKSILFLLFGLILFSIIVIFPVFGEPANDEKFKVKYSIGRGDQLILKTMNRDEILVYILDNFEEALLELEPAWVQENEKSGHWKLPKSTYGTMGNKESNIEEWVGAVVVYGMLLLERKKDVYAGKYPRELILKHFQDFRRGHPETELAYNNKFGKMVLNFFDLSIPKNEPWWEGKGRKVKKGKRVTIHPEKDLELFNNLKNGRYGKIAGIQGGGGKYTGFFFEIPNRENTYRWKRSVYTNLVFWSSPIDRAVRWSGIDDRPLSDLMAMGYGSLYPDGTTMEHGQFSWNYIMYSTGLKAFMPTMMAASLAQFPPSDLQPSFQVDRYPFLGRSLRSAWAGPALRISLTMVLMVWAN